MRLLEWGFLVSLVVAWIIEMRLRPSGAARVAIVVAPVVVLIAHVLIEGVRWQLVPAYLGVVFYETRLLRKWVSFSTFLSGVLAVFGMALGILFPVPDLPLLSGPTVLNQAAEVLDPLHSSLENG